MNYKAFMSLFLMTFISTFSIGCVKKPLTKLEPKKDSAIIAGKVYVYYNGLDVSQNTDILFNEVLFGKYAYKTDSSHILLTELPLGEAHIARLQYENFILNLPREKSTFTLKEPSKINYLGDIVIDWKGNDFKAPNMFGLAGALADEANPDGVAEIYVESNMGVIQEYINQKFGPGYQVIPNEIRAANFDSTAQANLYKSHNPKKEYFDVLLKDGEQISGKVISKKDDELYVKRGKVIYLIKLHRISKILDNGVDVTEPTLQNTQEKYVDLFKYVVEKRD